MLRVDGYEMCSLQTLKEMQTLVSLLNKRRDMDGSGEIVSNLNPQELCMLNNLQSGAIYIWAISSRKSFTIFFSFCNLDLIVITAPILKKSDFLPVCLLLTVPKETHYGCVNRCRSR